jgi:hypothetical protein
MHQPNDNVPNDNPPAIAQLKQRLIDLLVRGAFAIQRNEPGTLPSRAEVIDIAMAALNVALDEVTSADACHVENTRRTVLEILNGGQRVSVSKRDALFTLGVLFDVGLLDAFSDMVQGELVQGIATTAIANMAAEQLIAEAGGR